MAHLLSSWGEFGVPSNAPLHVVVALTMPAQVDGVGVHMDVHEVVHNLTLDVVLYTVHQELPTHIHHFDER